jgi:hypothetical protein
MLLKPLLGHFAPAVFLPMLTKEKTALTKTARTSSTSKMPKRTSYGSKKRNVDDLDADHDGIACEYFPKRGNKEAKQATERKGRGNRALFDQ